LFAFKNKSISTYTLVHLQIVYNTAWQYRTRDRKVSSTAMLLWSN